jgi:hypothetical protein
MSYEFTSQQNDLIGSLAKKMRLVGLVNVVFGVLYLISSLILLVIIFQAHLPAEVTQSIPEDYRRKVPTGNYLWGILIQTALAGLIFLMIGLWTRSSAASFQQIVDTTGRDIGHLMNALGSLHRMYSLIYTLIVITLLAFVVALGLQLYLRYGGGGA